MGMMEVEGEKVVKQERHVSVSTMLLQHWNIPPGKKNNHNSHNTLEFFFLLSLLLPWIHTTWHRNRRREEKGHSVAAAAEQLQPCLFLSLLHYPFVLPLKGTQPYTLTPPHEFKVFFFFFFLIAVFFFLQVLVMWNGMS